MGQKNQDGYYAEKWKKYSKFLVLKYTNLKQAGSKEKIFVHYFVYESHYLLVK